MQQACGKVVNSPSLIIIKVTTSTTHIFQYFAKKTSEVFYLTVTSQGMYRLETNSSCEGTNSCSLLNSQHNCSYLNQKQIPIAPALKWFKLFSTHEIFSS
jgi:hypothetical protein